MKKIVLAVAAAMSVSAVFAETNVVTHTVEQSMARQKRIAEWRETWAKMTPEQREAHRAEQLKRIAEMRAKAVVGKKEVKRETSKDGSIAITYDDGTVVVHRFPVK